MTSDNRPIHEIKLARIRATIWLNQDDGQRVWYSVTVTRIYRDGETWKDSTSFRREDLPLVAKAADMAYAWIWKTAGTKQANQHAGS